ncbi:hypothetical protein Nepgr_033887 [Nepenthes gracilis]|uniref:Secreted protein n=1 Tax=Nepenthes gracilis TaxID=150966 RepID=A0AAD3TLG3_NEPGR|nr:hypothetical protein Nepgr_033887 [Nepenthes gracilis]
MAGPLLATMVVLLEILLRVVLVGALPGVAPSCHSGRVDPVSTKLWWNSASGLIGQIQDGAFFDMVVVLMDWLGNDGAGVGLRMAMVFSCETRIAVKMDSGLSLGIFCFCRCCEMVNLCCAAAWRLLVGLLIPLAESEKRCAPDFVMRRLCPAHVFGPSYGARKVVELVAGGSGSNGFLAVGGGAVGCRKSLIMVLHL